jgi:hypothetical protein
MALFDNNPLYDNISSLTNPVTSGLGNLFSGMNVFGAKPSEALTGILTKDQQDKLKNQALFQGLLGTAATYLATPKNLGAGSALPYLGKAFLGGMQSSQGAYDTALAGKVKQLELEQGARKLEMEGLTPLEKLMKRRETLSAVKQDDASYANAQNQIKILDQAIGKESGGLTGFGTGVEGSSLNLLARGSQNTPEGEAIRKTPAFALAYRNQTTPKYVDQVRMDENGNEYYVRVQIPASKLPSNILPPIYGEEGVTTQPIDMTQPQIDTKPGQVTPSTQQTTPSAQPGIVKKFGLTEPDKRTREGDLRKEYNGLPDVKAYNEVNTAYNQIKVATQRPSPANDLAAATKFMKLLDPNSVVRESELIMAVQASGLADRIANTGNRILNGEKLTATQRKDFFDAATQFYKIAEDKKRAIDTQYTNIGIESNLNYKNIIPGIKTFNPKTGKFE